MNITSIIMGAILVIVGFTIIKFSRWLSKHHWLAYSFKGNAKAKAEEFNRISYIVGGTLFIIAGLVNIFVLSWRTL